MINDDIIPLSNNYVTMRSTGCIFLTQNSTTKYFSPLSFCVRVQRALFNVTIVLDQGTMPELHAIV